METKLTVTLTEDELAAIENHRGCIGEPCNCHRHIEPLLAALRAERDQARTIRLSMLPEEAFVCEDHPLQDAHHSDDCHAPGMLMADALRVTEKRVRVAERLIRAEGERLNAALLAAQRRVKKLETDRAVAADAAFDAANARLVAADRLADLLRSARHYTTSDATLTTMIQKALAAYEAQSAVVPGLVESTRQDAAQKESPPMTDVEAIRKRLADLTLFHGGSSLGDDIAALLADREQYRKRVREWAISYRMETDGERTVWCQLENRRVAFYGAPEVHAEGCPAAEGE